MSVREELTTIVQRDGVLTPEAVLEAARPKTSPLHALFEWDNKVAGEQFRLYQAATLIRRCKVTVETAPETTARVRAYTNVPDVGYLPTDEALAEHRDVVLEQCRRDIAALRRKYGHLVEFDNALRAELGMEVAAA